MADRTNRELYATLTALDIKRDLETYLRALLAAGRAFGPREPDAGDALAMLTAAATCEPLEFDDAWLARLPAWQQEPPPQGLARFEAILVEHIADLRRMRDNGQLANDLRYFGVESPSGARWYNFDPSSYLECGLAGSVGGWQDDDEVVLVTPPEVVAEDDETRRSFGWEGLCDLLVCGRCYE